MNIKNRIHRLIISICFAVFVLHTTGAIAAPAECTLFVDADNGSDSNDGLSETSAWKSINRATTDWNGAPASAGDVVCVKASTSTYNGVVYLRVSGTQGDPITLLGYPGPGGQRPVINGSWACFTAEDDVHLHDIAIDGFRCNVNGTGFNLTNYDFYGYQRITIRNNEIYTTGDLGIFIEVPPPGSIKPEGGPQYVSSDILIENNVVDGADSECLYIGSAVSSTDRLTKTWENPFNNITIRGNNLSNCEEALDVKQNVSDLYFYNNTIETSGKSNGNAVRLDGQNAELAYNTFRNNGATGGWSHVVAFADEQFSGHSIHHNYFIDTVLSSANIGLPTNSRFTGAQAFSVYNNSFIGSHNYAMQSAAENGSEVLIHSVFDNAFSNSGSDHFFGDASVANFSNCNAYDDDVANIWWENPCIAQILGLGIDASNGALQTASPLIGTASDGSNVGAWQGPQADFSANASSGSAPLSVQFSDLSVLPVQSVILNDGKQIDYSITDWLWQFGDGFSSTEENPLHSYESDGIFDVTLTVTNRDGSVATAKSDYITVTAANASCDYFVDGSVASSGDGSEAAPWLTISEALATGSPADGGGKVCIKNGIYSEDVNIEIEGSSNNPLIVQAYPGHSPQISANNYCIDIYNPDPNDQGDEGFDYQEYITIDGLECVGAKDGGMIFIGVSNLVLRNNTIRDTTNNNGTSSTEPGILIGSNAPNFDLTIENNVLQNITGEGIYIGSHNESGSGETWDDDRVSNVVIRGNTVDGCDDEAFDIKENVETVVIENNIVSNAGLQNGYAVRLDGKYVNLQHNRFTDCGSTSSSRSYVIGFSEDSWGTPRYEGHTIHHNYFFNTKTSGGWADAVIKFPEFAGADGNGFHIQHNSFIGAANYGIHMDSNQNPGVVHTIRDNVFINIADRQLKQHSNSASVFDFNAYDAVNIDWVNNYSSLALLCNEQAQECSGIDGSVVGALGVNLLDASLATSSPLIGAASDGTDIGAWQSGLSTFILTATKAGSGAGQVTSTPAGIDCGIDCSQIYATSTPVVLVATADPGSNFIGWSGACTGFGNCMVTMDQAQTVTATFDVSSVNVETLNVSLAGTGTGQVQSTPQGIDCGTDCSEDYAVDTQVVLTATADPGSDFAGWSGACSGTGNCTVTMSQAHAVTATFNTTPVSGETLTVALAGLGSGQVISTPGGINCEADCTEDYATGTEVVLTANANAGSDFVGWAGACTGIGSCTVTMNQAETVTATFDVSVTTLETLNVSLLGGGSGSVQSTPLGINCGADCSEDYSSGTMVQLTTTADPGSIFSGWSGACTGTGSCSVLMDQTQAVSAMFDASGQTVIFEVTTARGVDDAEERISNGKVLRGSSDLELVNDDEEYGSNGDQIVGLRFRNVTVPAGAIIVNAYITLTADETGSDATSLIIHGEATKNSVKFSRNKFDLSNRTLTVANTAWNNIPAWTLVGESHNTPDLSAVVQEIVNLAEWVSNGSMSFMISGSGKRTARSHNWGKRDHRAALHIEYSVLP